MKWTIVVFFLVGCSIASPEVCDQRSSVACSLYADAYCRQRIKRCGLTMSLDACIENTKSIHGCRSESLDGVRVCPSLTLACIEETEVKTSCAPQGITTPKCVEWTKGLHR